MWDLKRNSKHRALFLLSSGNVVTFEVVTEHPLHGVSSTEGNFG